MAKDHVAEELKDITDQMLKEEKLKASLQVRLLVHSPSCAPRRALRVAGLPCRRPSASTPRCSSHAQPMLARPRRRKWMP